MPNYTIKVRLDKLDGATLQTNPSGKRALIIPIEDADLFVGQNGAVYLDLSMWENRNGIDNYGNSHSVKKSYSKEMRERLGADAIKNKPYLGNAKPMPDFGQNNSNNNAPAATAAGAAPADYDW